MPGWPKKLHISIWDHITLRRLMTERRVICQKFQKLSRMKCIICILVQLNILCLICINRQYPKIALNLPMTHEFCSICFRNAVKQGRSLTHVVSPDKIHIRSKSEWGVSCLPNDCWGEENISCKALWFLSLFQNLLNAETDLVFVQSDAKINSVYYCENILEQGLLPAICSISNNNFVVHQDIAPAHRSHHTVAWVSECVVF